MLCAACLAEIPASDRCPACGAEPLLAERYRLHRVVGRGAVGVVFRAERLEDGRVVAIKTLALPHGRDPRAEARCLREIEVLRQLDHPAIPAFLEHFFSGSGISRQLHLVQAFVEGETLAEELAHHRYTEDEVLAIVEEVALILADLHRLSPPVVHRDVKPGNVIRGEVWLGADRRGPTRLHLVDFGAVRDALRDPALGGSTVAGTFGYMAPEQFRGDASPATDAWGLGALAVALLSRREPGSLMGWDGQLHWKSALGLGLPEPRHAREGGPASPGEAPGTRAATVDLLEDLLAPDPDLRATSLARVAETAARIRAGTAPARPRPSGRRAAPLVTAGLSVSLLFFGFGGVFVIRAPEALPPQPAELADPPKAPPQPAPEPAPGVSRPRSASRVVVPALAPEDAARCASNGLLDVLAAETAWNAANDTWNPDITQLGWIPDVRCRWYTAFRVQAGTGWLTASSIVTRGEGMGRVFRVGVDGTVTEEPRVSEARAQDLTSEVGWLGNLPDPNGPDGWMWRSPAPPESPTKE